MLAFLISIPLEVLIFKTKIDKELNDEIRGDEIQTKKELETRYGLPVYLPQLKGFKDDSVKFARNQLLPEPPTGEYRTARADLQTSRSERTTLQNLLAAQERQQADWYARIPLLRREQELPDRSVRVYYVKNKQSAAYRNYQEARKDVQGLRSQIKAQDKTVQTTEQKELAIRQNYYTSNRNALTNIGRQLTQKIKQVEQAIADVNKRIAAELPVLQSRGFVREFTAMESAAWKDGGMLFLLWVVRLVFFLIELLPTLVKIVTPVGEYDWKLYEHEQDFSTCIQTNLQILLDQEQQRKDNEKVIATDYETMRKTAEHDLNETVLRETADRQNKLAIEKLEEWYQQNRTVPPPTTPTGTQATTP